MKAPLASALVACALGGVLAGCGAAPAGRLGADAGNADTTRPGTPVEVVNTTTTGSPNRGGATPSVTTAPGAGGPGSGSGSGSGNGSTPALGFPSGGSGGASGSGSGQGSGQAGTGTGAAAPGSEEAQMQAMVSCLGTKGISLPPPSTDSNGKPVYDQAAFAALSQDPKAQAAAQACAGELGIAAN